MWGLEINLLKIITGKHSRNSASNPANPDLQPNTFYFLDRVKKQPFAFCLNHPSLLALDLRKVIERFCPNHEHYWTAIDLSTVEEKNNSSTKLGGSIVSYSSAETHSAITKCVFKGVNTPVIPHGRDFIRLLSSSNLLQF